MTVAIRTIQQPKSVLAMLTVTTGMVETTQNVSVAGSSVALAAFMAGAAGGHHVNDRLVGRRAGLWLAPAVGGEAVLIMVAALAAIGVHARPGHLTMRHLIVIAVLATAMGWRNATIRRVAMPDMLTTLVTGTLTALLMGPWRGSVMWRAVSVTAMVVGAVIGTLLLWLNPTAALLAVAAVELSVATLSRDIKIKS